MTIHIHAVKKQIDSENQRSKSVDKGQVNLELKGFKML